MFDMMSLRGIVLGMEFPILLFLLYGFSRRG